MPKEDQEMKAAESSRQKKTTGQVVHSLLPVSNVPGSAGKPAITVPSSLGGVPTLTLSLPRTASTGQPSVQAVHVPTTSLAATHIVSPQTINLIQCQLSPGIVGLSTVSAQGLQLLQASGTPLTFVTATSPGAAASIDQNKGRLQQQKRQLSHKSKQSSPSAGGTVHYLASPSSAKPTSSPNQNISLSRTSMSGASSQTSLVVAGAGTQKKMQVTSQGSVVIGSSLPATTPNTISISARDLKVLNRSPQTSGSLPVTRPATMALPGGPSPKKIKLEPKTAPNKEVERFRQSVLTRKRNRVFEIKRKYREHLTELFYLQGGGNMTEFNAWKKRPSQPLLNFLEGSKLDSDDEDEPQEKMLNDEVKVLTSVGSNVPLATPVAISTTLPPSVSALSQQGANPSTTSISVSSSSLTTTSSSELQQHLVKTSDVKPNTLSLKTHSPGSSTKTSKLNSSPNKARQQSISSVYENVTGGSKDVIVERAKQEAQILQRVNDLRKEGLWSAKRLPRVQEPPRQKAHWDYLLEEMTWLAADFIQERKWKKAAAKKLARMVNNHFKEQEQKELKAEKEEAVKLKKIASQVAKMVKEFWINIEKVVQYKQTTRMEEKKKKALDLHLSFIVDQTEKYSSWLTAGLQKSDGSHTPSLASDVDGSNDSGEEFQPLGTASDDEETIEKEENESGVDEDAAKEELEALQKESELPLEELLKTLPQEMLENPAKDLNFDDMESMDPLHDSLKTSKDDDFVGDEEESDVEDTIDEQETHEKKDYSGELDDLKAEGEMSVEELMKKYAGAYEDDFEMPEDSSNGESGTEEDESSESEKESDSSSEEEEVSEDENMDTVEDKTGEGNVAKDEMGLEFLVKKENSTQEEGSNAEGPGKEFNDIAAQAQSLQPKGYTLETTEVKTKVPFLLKHTLREYQHVGLDWLATMHEKRLNGILADEMGLGKTIQTIAMLAHLACDKGVWGPHLIVVPTSVMLNWEMELKKWCPAFKILTYYGSIKERKLKRQGWTKTNAFHVCITSYKLVVQDHQAFRRKKWKYLILDEAQNIKNFKSQRWQMLLNFSSQRRLLLTGTPLQNSLMELWSLMHFLMPNVFQSHSEFKEWFSNPLTGMIEGSQEYNESLVRRLHKVLRPFLLRRLKNEVEKQMPQKFEHVVMCRLSKRQRYLYDDFMSQAKTKETLATGHFMSVINILMQLRKVCNHPNLFDPRPIISPFKMEGICYETASLATKVLEYDPLRDVNLFAMYPNLAEMETDLPAFVAQRVKQLKASGNLIQEIDSLPQPPPRPEPGQLKNLKSFPVAPIPQVIKAQPASSLSTATTKKSASSAVQSTPTSVNSIKLLLPPSSSGSTTQQTILIPNPSGSGPPLILPLSSVTSTSGSTSAAIAQAKLISSQLQSGALQLVQTSSGHQILTSASSSQASSISSVQISSSSVSKYSSAQSSEASSIKPTSGQKPVMRVSPFVVSSSDTSLSSQGPTTTTSVVADSIPAVSEKRTPKLPMKRSELFMESLYRKKEERRQHILALMSRLNNARCEVCPVWGSDTRWCINCLQALDKSNASTTHTSTTTRTASRDDWCMGGYLNCLIAQQRDISHAHPDVFWHETSHLRHAVHAPEDWLQELKDILNRFVFVTPQVISPAVSMRVFHPSHSDQSHQRWLESRLRPVVVQGSSALHPIQSRTMVTFPELRLIQYDCGKLQTLDRLLRQLKSGQHRVLIFTQMTKMLDVLEAFLNFHGHRYLRLDGTTKVEQRQYLMDRFNADPRIFCFILSTRSGGIGVNLTGADTVIFYDSDWNPTMDAQAQDRCHRIGQTRDVHIYRLVSEMTVEENILKKANQKRLLGDLAIEGGNFTTAFFKEQTITDLFAEPSGLDSLVKEKEKEKEAKERELEKKEIEMKEKQELERKEREETKKEAAMLTQYEQALCKAEDETDAQAAKQLQAEQKAELAEFDENIPWDEREAELRKEEEEEVSKVEMELAMLDKELTPIERYAVCVIEAQTEEETAEELKMAEEDIQNSKKDWELARLKALKEEEERRAELEEDEMLYIYSKDESQMFISELDGSEMPMWCPPTPPQDDNDIYMDDTLAFLYDSRIMPEQALPPVYVPKAHKKPKLEAITTRKQKQRKEEQPRVPRSLFDKPKEVVMKQRRDAKMQRLRHNFQVPTKMMAGRSPMGQQQSQPPTPQPTPIIAKPEPDPNYPEWLVHEEWALLEAVQHIQKLNSDLLIDNPAQIVNWDFVADFVSVVGRCYRAAKHCRYQYEYVVLPREDGKIVYNMKQKKASKSIYKTKNSRPLRTEQLYSQEGLRNFSQLYDIRFTAMMDIGSKRPATLRQTIVNPAAKPTKHNLILAEQGISYETPLLPHQLATKRAERIAMDKKKQQQQAAAAAAQQQQQQQQQQQAAAAAAVAAAQQQAQAVSAAAAVQDVTALAQRTVQAGLVTLAGTPAIQGQQLSSIVSVTPTTVITGQVPKVAVGAGLSAVSIARTLGAGNIIVNAPAGLQSGPFAAINKRISQATLQPTTIAVPANLAPTIRGQRPSTPTITMQELATSTAITVASVATARPLIQTTVAASSLGAGQKIAAMTAAGGLQSQLTARSLTPHQINILRQSQQSIIRTQAAGSGGAALRAQRLLTPDQLRAQQLKHTTQKVITQQLLVPVNRGGQSILQGKPGLLRTALPTRMADEQLQALRMRTQMQAQGKQLQTAQIIQGQVTPGVATSQTPVALVKSVSASPAVTVTGTIPVSGLAVTQQRTVVASKSPTVSQLQQQRMQLLQQRKLAGQPKVTGLAAAGKAGQQIPLLIPQNRLNTVLTSNQILHQIGLVNKGSGSYPQIITHPSQPTIITQVSQAAGQPITQMKVSLTSGNQSLAPGTPITVTHVTSAGGISQGQGQSIGLSLSGPGPVKTATITSLEAGATSAAGIQVHAVSAQAATAKQQTQAQQSLVTAQAVVGGQQQQSLVTAQAVQIQPTVSSANQAGPVQFLQVTPASSGSAATQVTSVLRAVSVVSRASTPTQISLVSGSPAASQSSTQAQSVQPATTSESSTSAATTAPHIIAHNVPAPAAMATVVTQTNQPEATQSKASPYAMRTRNTKH